jgi:ribonuclease Z
MIINKTQIKGSCIGSQGTNIRLPKLKVMWDIGFCSPEAVSIPTLLLTHGHPDHAGGLVNYLFQRTIQSLEPPKVVGPANLLPTLEKAVKLYASLHQSDYLANWVPVQPGKRTLLSKNIHMLALEAVHSIETYAYLLFYKTGKCPLIAYTGDTQIEILDHHPILYQSEVLLLECTYFGPTQTVAKARKHKHIHFDEILARASLFNNKQIVLVHRSPIYTKGFMQKFLKENTPKNLQGRLSFLP